MTRFPNRVRRPRERTINASRAPSELPFFPHLRLLLLLFRASCFLRHPSLSYPTAISLRHLPSIYRFCCRWILDRAIFDLLARLYIYFKTRLKPSPASSYIQQQSTEEIPSDHSFNQSIFLSFCLCYQSLWHTDIGRSIPRILTSPIRGYTRSQPKSSAALRWFTHAGSFCHRLDPSVGLSLTLSLTHSLSLLSIPRRLEDWVLLHTSSYYILHSTGEWN